MARFFSHWPVSHRPTVSGVGPRDEQFRKNIVYLQKLLEKLSQKSQLLDNEQLLAADMAVRCFSLSVNNTMRDAGVR
jgi:hypothetical protein